MEVLVGVDYGLENFFLALEVAVAIPELKV
jgi:hypothetical protein